MDVASLSAEKVINPTPKVYVWASTGGNDLQVRFFLLKHNTVWEDHGTGSAAAN